MTAPFDNLVEALAVSGATWSVRPGLVVSATFARREQRNGFRDRFHHGTVNAAGQAFILAHAREWVDEHGFGVTLWPDRTPA